MNGSYSYIFTALGNPVYGIPEHLVKEVEQENEKLRKERSVEVNKM